MYRPNMLKLNNECLVVLCVSRLNKSDCRQQLLCPSSFPINKFAVPERLMYVISKVKTSEWRTCYDNIDQNRRTVCN